MNGAQFVIAETRSRHDAGGEVLNQHVDLRYDRPDELAATRLLDIDGQALFRVIVLEKEGALRGRFEFGIARFVAGGAATVAMWRQLHLGDVEHAIAR